MRTSLRWLLLLLIAISGGSLSYAQSTNSGDIRGTVTDSSGALIPGTTVTVVNVETGVSKTLTTNQDGIYDTSSIVVGSYTVSFTRDGFNKLVRGPITVQAGVTNLNATLQIGAATEQVIVNTDIPLLQTETGDKTSTLDSKALTELPEVGSSWENFMILLPGTTGNPNASQGAANPGQSVAANGNMPYSNVLADGASTTLSHSQNANPAILDTVEELQVSLSSFSAQYGIGGMIVNQITKGGTNKFHGMAYEYLQNSFFNSRAFTYGNNSAAPTTYVRHHNFGANVGGPVLKNKAFFFFDYDQIVDHGAGSLSYSTVPTAAIMSGNFSTDTRLIYDPTTQTTATDANGTLYPVRKSFLEEYGTNAIPSSMIDPVVAAFQKYYPTESNHISGGSFGSGTPDKHGVLQDNWQASIPGNTPYRKYFGRFDYDITPNNRITMSDTQSDTPVIYPNSMTACPIQCQSGDVDNNNAQITDVWNISPTVINEARIGYTVQLNYFADLSLGKGLSSELGWQFAKADTIPAMYLSDGSYSSISPSSNSVYKEHVFDPSDVVTMIRGKHILHFGGELLIYQDNSTAWGNTNAGSFNFSGQYTQNWTVDQQTGVAKADSESGIDYADMLLGLSKNWSASVTPEYGARLKSPQVFVQDDFKLRPNLTINMGIRYQINHGWNEVKGNIDAFDPKVKNSDGTLGAMWYSSTHANDRKALQKNVFSVVLPRFGMAWQPRSNTTIHGGVGLYAYNWSLDNYGNGMGSPFGSSGSDSDQTNGVNPIVKVGGTGTVYGSSTALPYTEASTAVDRFNGQSVTYNAYDTPVPKIIQWNVAVQRQFASNYVAEVAYIGSHGYGMRFITDLNAVPKSKLSTNNVANRPYTNFQNINGSTYETISNYHSLQLSLNKRLSHGVSFGSNYVWSHFLDDQDSAGWGSRPGPQNYQIANDHSANYGNSNFDMRNALKGNVSYVLPFGKGATFFNQNALVDTFLGGWHISSAIVLASGQPFMVYTDNGTYSSTGSAWQYANNDNAKGYPNWNKGVSWKPKKQSPSEWVNPQAFTLPAAGTFGNVKRNSLIGPGFRSIDMSAGKTFKLPWEGIKFDLRCDAQNVFNHTSWGNPGWVSLGSADSNGVFQGPVTSQITNSAVSGRNLQFTGKVSF